MCSGRRGPVSERASERGREGGSERARERGRQGGKREGIHRVSQAGIHFLEFVCIFWFSHVPIHTRTQQAELCRTFKRILMGGNHDIWGGTMTYGGLAGWLGGWLAVEFMILLFQIKSTRVQIFDSLTISDKMYYSSTDISRSCLLDYVGSPTCPLL